MLKKNRKNLFNFAHEIEKSENYLSSAQNGCRMFNNT